MKLISFSKPTQSHQPGDVASFDDATAASIVASGAASFSTYADAIERFTPRGINPETKATYTAAEASAFAAKQAATFGLKAPETAKTEAPKAKA